METETHRAHWGEYEKSISHWITQANKTSLVRRLWSKDASLWTKDPDGQKDVRSRLGWLEAPTKTQFEINELEEFSEEILSEHFQFCVLLGMGGSSLAPEVLCTTLGSRAGFPELIVLDSTDPVSVKQVETKIDLAKTLFIVSSKSGGTIEVMSFYKYFFEKVKALNPENPGAQFVAITDPGTSLERLAQVSGFRKVFLAPPDVGGRFSALTYFGMVPAALIGADIAKLLDHAHAMMQKTATNLTYTQNEAVDLGVAMAVLSEEGRDKLTLVTSPELASFQDWVEQLVAESTGKEESGILPVVRETLSEPSAYGADRFFVAILLDGSDNSEIESKLGALQAAGHPVRVYQLEEKEALAAEFFRWEMATAIASSLLKINAFDQPDVQSAKDKTQAILASGKTKELSSVPHDKNIPKAFFSSLEEGHYVAILAFLPNQVVLKSKLGDLAAQIRAATKNAVTVGLGPRYLHSTGQFHKGGPDKGRFLILTAAGSDDVSIPGESYGFAALELAQAMGDLEALKSKGRQVVHLRLDSPSESALDELMKRVEGVLNG